MPATILSFTTSRYSISILDTSLSSADPGDMVLGPEIFTLVDNGDGKSLFKRINTNDVSISVLLNNQNVLSFYQDMIDSPEGKYYLKIEEGVKILFIGKILSAIEEVLNVSRPFIQLKAIDGLRELQDIDFDLNVFGDKQLYSWTYMFLYILNKISSIIKLANDSDIILIAHSAWTTENAGNNIFFDVAHTVNFFQDESIKEYYKPKNCYDALTRLLTVANARIDYYGATRYIITSIDTLIDNNGKYLGYTKDGSTNPLINQRTITVDGFDPATDNLTQVDYVAPAGGSFGWLPAAKRIDLKVEGDSLQYTVGRGTTWGVDDQGNKVLGVLSQNAGKKIRVSWQAYLPRTFGGSPLDQYAVFEIIIKSNDYIWQLTDNSGTVDALPYQIIETNYDGPETKFLLRAKTKIFNTDLELYEQYFILNDALHTGVFEMSVTFVGYEYPDGTTMTALEKWKVRVTGVSILESSDNNYTELLTNDLTVTQINDQANTYVIKETTSFASIATQVEFFEKIPKDLAPATLLEPIRDNVSANGFTGNIESVLMNSMLKLMMKSVKYYSGSFKARINNPIPRMWNRIVYRNEVYIPLHLTTNGKTRIITGIFAKLTDNPISNLPVPQYPDVLPSKIANFINQGGIETNFNSSNSSSFYQLDEDVTTKIVNIYGYQLPNLNDVTLTSARKSIQIYVGTLKYFLVDVLTAQDHVTINSINNTLEFAVNLRGARVETFIKNEFEINNNQTN